MVKKGDFTSATRAAEFAQEQHDERSEKAQRVDERNRAPVTTDASRWKENPEALDFPGVDTPTNDPKLLPKDLKNKARTDVAAKAKGEAQRVTPEPSRNTSAPEQEVAGLFNTDISFAPEEAFEGVGSGHLFGERKNETTRPPEQALQEQQAALGVDPVQPPSIDEIKETATDMMSARYDAAVEANQGGNRAMQQSEVFGRTQSADVSLTPEEVIGDAMSGSIRGQTPRTNPDAEMNAGFADIPEAVEAVGRAEEDRGDDSAIGALVNGTDQRSSRSL